MKHLIAIMGLIAVLVVAPTHAASRNAYVCNGYPSGVWPAGTITPLHIDSDLVVPEGASCYLYMSEVTGNVTVEGILGGLGNTFDGNVSVHGGQVFFPTSTYGLGGNHVLGNLHIATTGAVRMMVQVDKNLKLDGASDAELFYAGIGGNVSITDSANVLLIFIGTSSDPGIGGNVSLVRNHNVRIDATTIGGKLSCEANDPAPVIGVHVTAGSASGQCDPLPGV
jgi:hypothetical protein